MQMRMDSWVAMPRDFFLVVIQRTYEKTESAELFPSLARQRSLRRVLLLGSRDVVVCFNTHPHLDARVHSILNSTPVDPDPMGNSRFTLMS